MSVRRLVVDLEALDALVTYLDAAHDEFVAHAVDLERRIGGLHVSWLGAAAASHAEAHREWTAGLQSMQEALSDLRASVRTARANHSDAVEANLTMWRALW